MSYQWDDRKAAANLEKHGIDFADAVSVFSDDLAITICDERFDEERFITIGLDAFGGLYLPWSGGSANFGSESYATRTNSIRRRMSNGY
jgi:hypothetical protein